MRGLPLAPGEGLTLTAYTAEPDTPSHDGLKLPASLTRLGPRTGQAILVAGWYAGLTALALAFAYRGRGLAARPARSSSPATWPSSARWPSPSPRPRSAPQPQPCQPP